MLRRVALVRIDVSEELSASIIKVTIIGELRTLAVASNRHTLRRNTSSPILVTLMMEELHSSETSVLTRITRRNILEDDILQNVILLSIGIKVMFSALCGDTGSETRDFRICACVTVYLSCACTNTWRLSHSRELPFYVRKLLISDADGDIWMLMTCLWT
jgi:hypothetical protein